MNGFTEKAKTALKIFLRCAEFCGEDAYGNRYFKARNILSTKLSRKRRWVLYKGRPEGSKIPPLWQAWLTFMLMESPAFKIKQEDPQRKHYPNLTGAKGASLFLKKEDLDEKNYKAWDPQ